MYILPALVLRSGEELDNVKEECCNGCLGQIWIKEEPTFDEVGETMLMELLNRMGKDLRDASIGSSKAYNILCLEYSSRICCSQHTMCMH